MRYDSLSSPRFFPSSLSGYSKFRRFVVRGRTRRSRWWILQMNSFRVHRWKEVSRERFYSSASSQSYHVISWKNYNSNIENRENYFHLFSKNNHPEIFPEKLLIILITHQGFGSIYKWQIPCDRNKNAFSSRLVRFLFLSRDFFFPQYLFYDLWTRSNFDPGLKR